MDLRAYIGKGKSINIMDGRNAIHFDQLEKMTLFQLRRYEVTCLGTPVKIKLSYHKLVNRNGTQASYEEIEFFWQGELCLPVPHLSNTSPALEFLSHVYELSKHHHISRKKK